MSGRNASIKRLAALYGLVEHARAMEVGLASAAVSEVKRATAALTEVSRRQAAARLAVLQEGGTAEWAMARAAQEAVEIRRRRLDGLWVNREAALGQSVVSYRASRIETKQMEGVLEQCRVQGEMESARRMQLEADDRYLSRREWVKREERRQGRG